MRMHLNLATRDLTASVAFYRTLLWADPTKHYAEYALFLTDEPELELALDLDPQANVVEGAHYGIVVETADEVETAITRLQLAGYPIDTEKEATCCYAVQNKVWAIDPDGRRWETYLVVPDIEERGDDKLACCGGEAPVETNACCAEDAAAKMVGISGCGCQSRAALAALADVAHKSRSALDSSVKNVTEAIRGD